MPKCIRVIERPGNKYSKIMLIETMYLTEPLDRLIESINENPKASIYFVDPCKANSSVYASWIAMLAKRGIDCKKMSIITAPVTYNPLGTDVTFLQEDEIHRAIHKD